MPRLMIAALTLLLFTGDRGGLPENSASTRQLRVYAVAEQKANRGGPCDEIRWRQGQHEVRLLIECVWERFHPGYGGAEKALEVARCESGLNPDNDGGSCEGLFQHQQRLWPGRFEVFITDHPLRDSWGLSPSIWNGRTQAIVTALMVRRSGWVPAWSCA